MPVAQPVKTLLLMGSAISFGLSFCVSSRAETPSAGTTGDKIVQNFLNCPTHRTFLAILGENRVVVRQEMTSDGPELDKLCDQVSKGNLWAAQYLLLYLHKCDGGRFGERPYWAWAVWRS